MSIFISYSRENEAEKNELLGHLEVLLHGREQLEVWSEEKITAGADWQAAIEQAIGRARVAVLLVTKEFLASNFIRTTEVPRLLQRREEAGLVVIPLIARPCAWKTIEWLEAMSVRPKGKLPVWRDGGRVADEELAALTEEVADILAQQAAQAPPSPPPALSSTDDSTQSVYIHALGEPPADIPTGAVELDRRAYFSSEPPRRLPAEATWNEKLLPALLALSRTIRPGSAVRLRGSAPLSTGFAFGRLFREVARYRLSVDQHYQGRSHCWSAYAPPPPGAARPGWLRQTLPGRAESSEAVALILANPRQPLEKVVSQVGQFFGEEAAWVEGLSGGGRSQRFRQVLALQAEKIAQGENHLENWEAVGLAQQAVGPLQSLSGVETVHLFMAVPLALAAFMGHYWNAMGKQVYAYEWSGGQPPYVPAWQWRL